MLYSGYFEVHNKETVDYLHCNQKVLQKRFLFPNTKAT